MSEELTVEDVRTKMRKISLDAGSKVAYEMARSKPNPLDISYSEGFYDGVKKCMEVFKNDNI